MRRACAALLLTALSLGTAAPAQAATYRYWSFWDRDGSTWTYATQGPSVSVPSDGEVKGFRFALSEDSADASQPRGTATFGTICARTPARDGQKRVALVLDFGTPKDAPSGETPPKLRTACAQVAEDATTAEALAEVAKPLRYDSSALLCAIEGYPGAGCGDEISKPAAKSAKSDDDSPSLGLWAGAAGVAALGAAAFWQSRRRRNA
ncbi:SCO2322 family protein [Streptomyces cinnabarinus]|uniref:SCO2322 family protein n=1 Tax=Streptomyces cinnabarinus TaxID=67287 RepID=A0ABY7KUG6_9ACTN|nr:SCO2322 family protein [Streptomyces cinnabarinus]WAZ27072.1 SCO2322 family protein [Streptomyces cinnabarinus]